MGDVVNLQDRKRYIKYRETLARDRVPLTRSHLSMDEGVDLIARLQRIEDMLRKADLIIKEIVEKKGEDNGAPDLPDGKL